MKAFTLLVWKDGMVRVFGAEAGLATDFWPEFEGKFSLWLLIRLWWATR